MSKHRSGTCLRVTAFAAAGALLFLTGAKKPAADIRVHNVQELEHALDDLRHSDRGSVRRIQLEAGTYQLDRPLILDERTSHLAIAAMPGAHVVLSGGRDLGPLHWEPGENGIWRARVAGPSFALLWRDGRRLIRARYPNFDAKILPFGGVAADATAPERVARWHDPEGGVIHALHGSRWGGEHIAILGKNADGTLRLAEPTGNNRDSGDGIAPSATDRFVENIFEELDGPDEWYWDGKGQWLYYKPADGKRPSASGFTASHLQSILRVVGTGPMVHDVHLDGLEFRYTEPTFLEATEPLLRSDWKIIRSAAVFVANAEHVSLTGGTLSELGGNAVMVSGHARDIIIRDNEIAQVGATAIAFVGLPSAVRSPLFQYHQSQPLAAIDRTPGPKNDDYPADSRAEGNLIHDIGLIEKQGAGVEIATAARITVDHNSIYRVPRAGINIGDGTWGGHVISNNDVFDTVRETGDHGALNAWGRDRFWDPDRNEMDRRVAAEPGLVALDAIETTILRHNRFSCDHGWDIDLDDGVSNYLLEDNLLLVGGLKFREGFRRSAFNNIILNNTFHPHVWFHNSGDAFERNIVMSAYQPIGMTEWGKRVDHNLFPSAAALARARANGTDQHSIVGNPRFVAPQRGDYRIAPGSPAFAIGFRNFTMNDFGVTAPRLRAIAERPALPLPILNGGTSAGDPPREFDGIRLKTVETLGEQSAAGLPKREGALILAVEPHSPAARAGLRAGDVILQIRADGQSDEPTATSVAFIVAAGARRWQGAISVEIARNQARQMIELPLR